MATIDIGRLKSEGDMGPSGDPSYAGGKEEDTKESDTSTDPEADRSGGATSPSAWTGRTHGGSGADDDDDDDDRVSAARRRNDRQAQTSGGDDIDVTTTTTDQRWGPRDTDQPAPERSDTPQQKSDPEDSAKEGTAQTTSQTGGTRPSTSAQDIYLGYQRDPLSGRGISRSGELTESEDFSSSEGYTQPTDRPSLPNVSVPNLGGIQDSLRKLKLALAGTLGFIILLLTVYVFGQLFDINLGE